MHQEGWVSSCRARGLGSWLTDRISFQDIAVGQDSDHLPDRFSSPAVSGPALSIVFGPAKERESLLQGGPGVGVKAPFLGKRLRFFHMPGPCVVTGQGDELAIRAF